MLEPEAVLECVVFSDANPRECCAVQLDLLDQVAGGLKPPTLFIYSMAEEGVSLGRFHLAPLRASNALHRRLSGGRVAPMGPGFVGLSLMIPQRDWQLDGLPGSLDAARILNRYVRGFLKACRAVGIEPIYPGKDVVTVDKRIVAALGLECEDRGSAAFEMTIATECDFAALPSILDRVDPQGEILCPIVSSGEVTSLVRSWPEAANFETLVSLLRRGFAEQLGCVVRHRDGRASQPMDSSLAENWISARRLGDDLTHVATVWGQIGPVEVRFAISDGVMKRVVLSGDLIANASFVERIETALCGCRHDANEIETALRSVFGRRGDYLLGIGGSDAIRDAILSGVPR